jgi:hypothetical protein
VTIPASVPQRSEIPEGLMNHPVHPNSSFLTTLTQRPIKKIHSWKSVVKLTSNTARFQVRAVSLRIRHLRQVTLGIQRRGAWPLEADCLNLADGETTILRNARSDSSNDTASYHWGRESPNQEQVPHINTWRRPFGCQRCLSCTHYFC